MRVFPATTHSAYAIRSGSGTCIRSVHRRAQTGNQDRYHLRQLQRVIRWYPRVLRSRGPESGLEVVASEAFTSDNNTDFSVQLDKAKESGADLVFLPIYYQEASVILKQANDKDFHPQFFGCDGMDGIRSVDGFDKSLAEGAMLPTPFSVDEESSQDFVTAYRDAYGIDPLQFAADAYDGVYAIKAAAEKAEITPDMSTSDICDALKTAMTEIQIDGPTGTEMHWTAEGEPQKAPKAVEIKDGKYEMMQ